LEGSGKAESGLPFGETIVADALSQLQYSSAPGQKTRGRALTISIRPFLLDFSFTWEGKISPKKRS